MIKTQIFTKKILISASLGLGLSLAMVAPSVALADFFSSDNPIYVGGGFGKSKFKETSLVKFQDGTSWDFGGSDTAKTLFIGKQYNKNLDIEAFYMDLGEFKTTEPAIIQTNQGAVSTDAKGKYTNFGIRANYKFSLDSDFIPYVSLGYAKVKVKKSYTNGISTLTGVNDLADGTGLIYGVGIQKKYSSSITFRAEYTKPLKEVNLFWGGVSTTF